MSAPVKAHTAIVFIALVRGTISDRFDSGLPDGASGSWGKNESALFFYQVRKRDGGMTVGPSLFHSRRRENFMKKILQIPYILILTVLLFFTALPGPSQRSTWASVN